VANSTTVIVADTASSDVRVMLSAPAEMNHAPPRCYVRQEAWSYTVRRTPI
jgi:hypothetical protein